MTIKDCFKLGKFTKPFRYSGEVVLWMDVDDNSPYRNLKVVWAEERKNLVPYMINKLKPHKDRFVAVIDGIDSEEAARSICGKDLYLPLSELPDLGSEHFYFHEVPGWRVLDLNSGEDIGTINRVLDHGPYPMLEVEHESVELILPLPKNFMVEVDRENQILKVEIPEGLLEVFLNPGSKEEEERDNFLSDDFFQQ